MIRCFANVNIKVIETWTIMDKKLFSSLIMYDVYFAYTAFKNYQ